jgi:sulfur carrier protein ThiS
LQENGVSRALAEPLSAQMARFYQEAFRWLRSVDKYAQLAEGSDPAALLRQIQFTGRRVATVLDGVVPFLERAEDNLSENKEITHRESGYEREVAPFSRVDSTEDIRARFAATQGFSIASAAEGAQIAADLLKVIYIEKRVRDGIPKPADLYALVVEVVLDGRRHVAPGLAEGSEFMKALKTAVES